jgi:hypothetical protein
MCSVFRQHKAVADVLQCIDDDDNGKYCSLFISPKVKQDDRYEQS